MITCVTWLIKLKESMKQQMTKKIKKIRKCHKLNIKTENLEVKVD